MHTWEEELQAYRRRTKKSERAWQAAKRRIPFGVNSNYRLVDPYPLYIRKAKGSKIWDVDGNEYVDFNMAFGALVAGHSHPVLAKAMRERVSNGTIFGYESVDAGRLAEHICHRFHVDRLKFSMTGLDATLFAVRLARAVTGRPRILKFEGCYHGHADALLVGAGSGVATLGIPGSPGVPDAFTELTVTAPYNDLTAVSDAIERWGREIACVIVEPVAGNMGLVLPEPGFLAGLRELCTRAGALLMFGFFFHPGPVRNFADAKKADAAAFRRFFAAMLDAGIYLAPSAFEAGFVSLAHRPRDVAATLAAARAALTRVAEAR